MLTKFETVAICLQYGICQILVLPTLGEGKQDGKFRNIPAFFDPSEINALAIQYIIPPATPTEISHSLAIF